MSGVTSGLSIPTFLAAAADEQAQVTRYVSGDSQVQATVNAFEHAAPTLSNAAAILGNYGALQVLTTAYDMSGQINQTAVLRTLMTQDPDGSGSLVQQSSSTDYLHFARATETRNNQQATLGSSLDALSLPTGGNGAASLTMQNTEWGANTATAAAPGLRWSFVLNDGSADASVAAALDAAAKAAGLSASYGIAADGTVSGSPPVTVGKDNNGDAVYSLPTATDASGHVTQEVTVVSVTVAAGTTDAAKTAQLGALQQAVNSFGFDATVSGATFTVNDPAAAGVNTLARTYGSTVAIATSDTLTSPTGLALGDAGRALSAGQVLVDGSTPIGTIKSVDAFGNVTLTAATTASIAAGDPIQVATGLAFGNVGSLATAQTATAQGNSTLALGDAGTALLPGQNIALNGVTIGTIGDVAADGTVTLLAGSAQAVPAGATVEILPAVTAGTTAALSDAANLSGIVNGYETDSFESSMGQQYPGMDDALYYSRTMGGISSITQMMSDSRLLSVVTTSLGMNSYFGALDYDQQVSLLTQKVNLSTMTSAAGIKQTAEQYLIEKGQTASAASSGGILSLFTSNTNSEQSILLQIAGLPVDASSGSGSGSGTDPALALLA